MPSDFEKNKEQELDRYGVWIKSGPQDVNDTTGDTAVNLEPPVELQDLQEKQPVSENPASVDGSIEPESGAETETAEPDETGVQDALEELDLPPLSDFNSLDEETELPVKDEEITEADFEIQPSTEIKTSEGTENTMPEDTGSSKESPHINIVQDDVAASFEDDSLAEPDDDNESDSLPEEQTITVENDWISDKEDVPVWESEKTSHEADLKDAENPENDAESPESGSIVFAEDRDEFPDFSAFLDESELSQIDNMTPPPRTEKKESSGDGMEEISMDDFGLSDDFSEISLDDFMSDGSSSKAKENQAVFDDTPPLNIDLEFDDEFIEESKKMSRTQTDSDDLLSQFFDDDFGVEIIDESPDLSESSKISGKTEQTGSTDFDLSEIEGFEMFDDTEASPVSEEKPHEDNISSIGKTEEISLSDFDTESTGSETPETVKSSGVNDGSEDVTSEFDDILSEIGPSANQGSQSIDKPSSGDIKLTVTVEDDEETEEEPEPEMDNLEEEEEEISVPIYIEDAGKTQEASKPNNAPSPGDFDLSEIEGFEFLDSDSPSKKSEQNETISEETITQEETTAEPVVTEEEITAEPVIAEEETPLADLDFAEPAHQEEEIIAEPAEEDDEITAEPVFAEDEITAEPVVAEEETPLADLDFAEPALQEEEITAEPAVEEEKCGTEKEADNNKQEQVEAVNSETADVSDMFLESTDNSENTSETMKDLDIPPALGEPGDKETVEINTPKLDITNPFDDSLENTEGDSDTKENEKVESEENMNNDFDDVKAVEQDLLDTETKDTGSEPALDKTNEETTVLRKIAEELTSIKDEITTLKSELNNLKSVDTTASQVEESVQSGDDAGEVSIPTSQNDSENSGFFADDDTDESIALTGDELNNILTTADFTEEKSGVDEDHPVNDDSGEPEEVKTEDVDEGISDFEKELLENDEKTFDEEKAFEDPAYDTVEPVPITKIEDTNYLDGEDEALPAEELAIDEGEIPEIDFNDEVLVEPEETEISDTIKDLDINAKTPEIDTVTQEPTEEKEPEVEKEDNGVFTEELKGEIKTVLAYMDQLLENLPESKIEEFAKSEHFHVYKKLFDELGLS